VKPEAREYLGKKTISGDEVLAVLMARFLEDGDVLMVGFGDMVPVAAGQLARKLHAPNLTLILPCGAVNPEPGYLYQSPVDFRYLYHSEAWLDGEAIQDLSAKGKVDVSFITGVEVDMFGNVNQYKAGMEWSGPSEGAADVVLAERAKRIILYLRNQTRSRLVERASHVSLVGHVDGRAGRAKQKIESQGPVALLTDMAIFDFDDECMLRLRSVHEGKDVGMVAERAGFMLRIGQEVLRTEPPTSEELEVLRRDVDRTRMLKGVSPGSDEGSFSGVMEPI